MILHIFTKLPLEYYEDFIIAARNRTPNLDKRTLQDVKDKAKLHYNALVLLKIEGFGKQGIFHSKKDDDKSKKHNGNKPKGKFKGICKECGQMGHNAENCWAKDKGKKEENKKEHNKNITCHRCDKKGHYARFCPTKNKEELGLFCSMVISETLVEKSIEWKFTGMASFLDKEADDGDEVNNVVNQSWMEVKKSARKSWDKTGGDAVKWLLDTGATIHADFSGEGVSDEKSSTTLIKVADGTKVPVRGVGVKTLKAGSTGHSLLIKEMHVIPTFLKRILSVTKLIDDGFKVSFLPTKATINDQSGKTISCPRDPEDYTISIGSILQTQAL